MGSVTQERLLELIRDHEDDIDLSGQREQPAIRDTLSALWELWHRREVSGPMAPIARVTIIEDATGDTHIKRCSLYAPGLPAGEHDLYCEPPQREIAEGGDDAAGERLP